jgi:hypothetical protein
MKQMYFADAYTRISARQAGLQHISVTHLCKAKS